MIKKAFKILAILCFVILTCLSYDNITIVRAEGDKSQKEIEKELNENVDGVLKDFDFTELDKLLLRLSEDEKFFFNSDGFLGKIKEILSGEFADGYNSFGQAVLNLFFENLLDFIPMLSLIIAIAIISSLFNYAKPNTKGVGDIIHLICFGVIAVIIVKYVCDFIAITIAILKSITMISEIVFPILLTLITTMGGIVSGKVYQPVVLFLCNGIIKIFSTVLISLFIFSFVFSLISNFSTKLKFKKFSDFFSSTFKWCLGIIFFLFMTYLALQGITASMFDGMKIRTAKFAVRNYIPLLGGYLSEGFDFILSSLGLVKNAIGAGAILLLFSFIISPILKMAIFSLGLKLCSAICEPICDDRITDFLSGVAKKMNLLIALIVGASFMFLIIVGMMVLSVNAF